MRSNPSKKILVVDAAESSADFHASLLRWSGHDTVRVANGEDALERVLTDPPDLLVVELDLPSMQGLELISWIRRSEANRRTPIVVVTVRDDPGSRAACASHGCAGFLTKPVDPVELTRLVSAILEGSS
ncbi:MAG TPA: response regulator [Polyangiaceae bacterium]|nr:response regulator [Polyangiaceae bacterium]